jgi:hypothetical protein
MPANSPYSHRFRSSAGAAGAPSALLSGEIAYNMADGLLYVGFGDDGSGNATSIKTIAKDDFAITQRVTTGGTALQVYRKNAANTGYEWATLSGGTTYTGSAGIAIDGANNITADSTIARLASPAFTGTPSAPTQANADNSTSLATTAYVTSKLSALVNGASAAFDTLLEIQNIIQTDEGTLAALTTTVGGKLTAASNLSDVGNVVTARTNLGLASMATQAASAVAITGGTIAGVAIRGGTF